MNCNDLNHDKSVENQNVGGDSKPFWGTRKRKTVLKDFPSLGIKKPGSF